MQLSLSEKQPSREIARREGRKERKRKMAQPPLRRTFLVKECPRRRTKGETKGKIGRGGGEGKQQTASKERIRMRKEKDVSNT